MRLIINTNPETIPGGLTWWRRRLPSDTEMRTQGGEKIDNSLEC